MAGESVPALFEAALETAPLTPIDHLLVMPVALSFLFGAGLLVMRKRIDLHAPVAVMGAIMLLFVDLILLWRVAGTGPVTMMMGGWRPPFGIAFTLDVAGALFLAASAVTALACCVHAGIAVPRAERRYGFFPFFFLMMAGVQGAFLTGDVFNLYVWFEVLLIGSFGLVILGSRPEQLDGATKYAFLNLVGTTLFLVTTGLLYGTFGTLNMADIALKARAMEGEGTLLSIAVLYFAAASIKAAAFPVNFWLPASYHTPRFVVSALFAGLLTKVGVYAGIRILLMLFPLERAAMADVISLVAILTMIVGALGALAQDDLRRLLNFVVVAGIGTIFAGLAPQSGGPAAMAGLSGALFYAAQSMVVMAALYLAAGWAAQETGAVRLSAMGGLWRRSPLFSAALLALLFSFAGLPPFPGFWPKVQLVKAALLDGRPWLAAAILASGLVLTIVAARIVAFALWRPAPDGLVPAAAAQAGTPGEATHRPLGPILALALVVTLVGLLPQGLARLTELGAAGILDPQAYVESVFGSPPE
ncbi:Na+/H+ antiporter subunit D [Aurantimonas sp. Leaf443]|uniref:Na+/H+ antiporter subunit D n=1 Tax=Aurantimonas sp. Leaf443 TaxID=1736378 RepID=UPI0006F2900A|nr:Na+/H+ antiporter subunit D [Aurantimonas sp. Leaf443]KQT85980.1 cation:proton antiporter [Aurantimonas sp. Leaf443]